MKKLKNSSKALVFFLVLGITISACSRGKRNREKRRRDHHEHTHVVIVTQPQAPPPSNVTSPALSPTPIVTPRMSPTQEAPKTEVANPTDAVPAEREDQPAVLLDNDE